MEWGWAAAVGDPSRKNPWRHLLRGQNLAASPEAGGAQDILARACLQIAQTQVRLREQPAVPAVVFSAVGLLLLP